MSRVSEDYLKLIEYVKAKPDGATLDYETVQRETGISMSEVSGNRCKLGRAIQKSGRRALTYAGIGYELDDADNTLQIVDKAGQRVYRQIKRSSKTTKIVTLKHSAQLSHDDQGKLTTINRMYNVLERKTTNFEEIEVRTIKEIPQPDLEARK